MSASGQVPRAGEHEIRVDDMDVMVYVLLE